MQPWNRCFRKFALQQKICIPKFLANSKILRRTKPVFSPLDKIFYRISGTGEKIGFFNRRSSRSLIHTNIDENSIHLIKTTRRENRKRRNRRIKTERKKFISRFWTSKQERVGNIFLLSKWEKMVKICHQDKQELWPRSMPLISAPWGKFLPMTGIWFITVNYWGTQGGSSSCYYSSRYFISQYQQ